MKLSNVRNKDCIFVGEPKFQDIPVETWTVYLDGTKDIIVEYLKALCIQRKRHGNAIDVCILNEDLKALAKVWCLSTFKLGYLETTDAIFRKVPEVPEVPEGLIVPPPVSQTEVSQTQLSQIEQPFFVINLDRRTDRFELFEKNFQKYGIAYKRFSAIEDTNGALGCAKSHLAVLNLQKDLPFAFVAEDDACILAPISDLIRDFLTTTADVLLLGYNTKTLRPFQGPFFRVSNSLTTSCYVVRHSMIQPLIDCFERCVQDMQAGRKNPIDVEWQKLQKTRVFVVPKRHLVIQRESFSDIERKVVNYRV